jgi:5-methylcytosine-specific restriction endonuclease McrA
VAAARYNRGMVGKRHLRTGEPFATASGAPAPACPLCGRPIVPGPTADEHHLVPRSQGGKDTHLVHRICHRKIHATFSEKELARRFHTWAALRAHPEIADFVAWVANKPPQYWDRTLKPRRRR